LSLKIIKFELFIITPSVPCTLPNDICYRIDGDEQNSGTTQIFTYIFGRKPKQYFKWVVNVLKMIGVIQKRSMVALLFRQLNVDNR